MESALPQMGQRRRARFDQHVRIHDEAVPVAARRSEEIASAEEGELGHDVSASARREATNIGSPLTSASGTGRRRYSIRTRSDAVALSSAVRVGWPPAAASGPIRQLPLVSTAFSLTAPRSAATSGPTMTSMNSGTPSLASAAGKGDELPADPSASQRWTAAS